MKTKNLISVLLLLVVCVVGAINAYNQSQTPQYSALTLANIEAMAGDGPSGEGILGSATGPANDFECGIRTGIFSFPCSQQITVCMGKDGGSCSGSTCDRHEK